MGNSCRQCLTHEREIDVLAHTQNLIVCTLNYGGILKSPFEFYSDEEIQEKKLSDCFCRLLPIYIKNYDQNQFDWEIGKIDHKLQQQRFTPLYNSSVGIDQSSKNQKLITASKFEKLWTQHYKTGTKKTKIQPEPSQIQKDNMKLFDLICYHAIIDYVYGLTSKKKLSDMEKDLGKLDCHLYKQFMNKKFSKSFLDENKKIQKVLQALNHIDVALFQEPTKLFIDALKRQAKFFVKEKGAEGSMIVIRKEKFMKNSDFKVEEIPEFDPEQKYFDFDGNTDAVAVGIEKFIFISTHLSSKAQRNTAEVKALKEVLRKMKRDFKDYEIVLGLDANSYVNSEGLEGWGIFPKDETNLTTSKKRTFLQPQLKKADRVVEECKDHIISSSRIKSRSIETIQLKKVSGKELLPTDQHPFDHFMVLVEIQR